MCFFLVLGVLFFLRAKGLGFRVVLGVRVQSSVVSQCQPST